ncbi:insulinase family protein [candidate division KSB1 bacterium]|nr:insulinase family protein [candidate division KSB1 bacterium]
MNNKIIILKLVFFGFLVSNSLAQEKHKIFPFPVSVFELDNGLKVVGIDYDSPGIVAYYTIVRTGSRNEVEPGFSGYAHFFEHMMFRGTEKYSTEEYNAVIKRMGADSNAFTTDDWTAYHIVASADALETIMDIESDRFLNLKYTQDDFRTEAGAILGEYNLNFSNPFLVLTEKLHDIAFTTHSYKHTTIGLLEDIRNMGNNYDYSLQFYDRYYRPENCIVVVVGDFQQSKLKNLAEQYYGNWERGNFKPDVPVEPPQTKEMTARVSWRNRTIPYILIGYHAPAFSDTNIEMPAMDILSQLLFSQNSPLFQKLFVREQVVDVLQGGAVDHRDPPLFEIVVRVTKPDQVEYVRDAIFAEIETRKTTPIDPQTLSETKSFMRYSFAMGMNNPNNIATTIGHYLQLTEDPETVNRVYELYGRVTAEDIMNVAKKYFAVENRSVVILTYGGN